MHHQRVHSRTSTSIGSASCFSAGSEEKDEQCNSESQSTTTTACGGESGLCAAFEPQVVSTQPQGTAPSSHVQSRRRRRCKE
eukprot:EC837582.1.p2 GENE.EC837582.1~~EC837582.1.p2  ORF type:complete len:82 (+),score=0.61 EC837582.1:426-671(+)